MDLRVLTFVLSIFLVVDLGAGLQCHQCNGNTDKKCNDPFETSPGVAPATFLKDCEENKHTLCRKIYQDVRGEVSVIRSCAWEEYERDGEIKDCYKTVMEEYNTYSCTCNTDGCNGAQNIQISSLIMIVLPIVALGLFNQ